MNTEYFVALVKDQKKEVIREIPPKKLLEFYAAFNGTQTGKVQQQSFTDSSMDQAQQEADGLTKMTASADVVAIQHEAEPHLGGNIDLKG